MTNRHSVRILFLLLTWAAHLRPLLGQEPLADPPAAPELILATEPVYAGEMFPVAVKVPVPEGVEPTLQWKINGKPAGAKHLRLSGDGLTGISCQDAGSYVYEVKGAWGWLDDGKVRVAFIELEGTQPVLPNKPVPPGPEPPPVPPPGPAGPLSQLIPDPAKRALLGEFYADMALAVRAGQFTTTTHFRNAYREAIRQAQSTGALPTGLAAVDKPISDRIAAAIGLAADVPLDAAKNTALGDVFDAVAADFRGTKWPAS